MSSQQYPYIHTHQKLSQNACLKDPSCAIIHLLVRDIAHFQAYFLTETLEKNIAIVLMNLI